MQKTYTTQQKTAIEASVSFMLRSRVVHLAVCLSICYWTCEHDVLKWNEKILMQFGTSGPWGNDMKRSTLGSGGQSSRSHKAEVGHKNPHQRDFSTTIWQISTKPGRDLSFFLPPLGCHMLPLLPVLRPASQAGPMRNPREGTSVVLHDTIRLTWWCV